MLPNFRVNSVGGYIFRGSMSNLDVYLSILVDWLLYSVIGYWACLCAASRCMIDDTLRYY